MAMTENNPEKTKEEKTEKNKLHSRKFIVWLVATVFMLASIIASIIIKNADVATSFSSWWGLISVCYIGGNVAQDFIFNKVKNER